MTKTTKTFASEAPQAPSQPHGHMLVASGCRFGYAIALTGRRAG